MTNISLHSPAISMILIIIIISSGCITDWNQEENNVDYENISLKYIAYAPDGSEALISGNNENVGLLIRYKNDTFEKIFEVKGEYPSMGVISWLPSSEKAYISGSGYYGDHFLLEYDKKTVRKVSTPLTPTIADIDTSFDGKVTLFVGAWGVMALENETFNTISRDPYKRVRWSFTEMQALILGKKSVYLYENDVMTELGWPDNTTRNSAIDFTSIAWNPMKSEAIISGMLYVEERHNSTGFILHYTNNSLEIISYIESMRLSRVELEWTAWSPDGKQALITGYEWNGIADGTFSADGRLFVYSSSQITEKSTSSISTYRYLDWDRDGENALILSSGLVKYSKNGKTETIIDKGARLRWVDYSPVKDEALLVGNDSKVLMYDGENIVDLSVKLQGEILYS